MAAADLPSITVERTVARMIRERVDSGSFASESEVVDAAMQALLREEDRRNERLAEIRARIKASMEDTRPGTPLEEAFARVQQHIDGLAEVSLDPESAGSASRERSG
jgi:antitoxin ParD1/3/4